MTDWFEWNGVRSTAYGIRYVIMIPLLLTIIVVLWLLWPDYIPGHRVVPELVYKYPSRYAYRLENGDKVEPSMYTWFSYFKPLEPGPDIARQVFAACGQEHEYDFDNYVYILSYGYTIRELQYTGRNDLPKMRAASVVHGFDCEPNDVLLYRIPKVYIEPYEDREDRYWYKFRK